MRASQLPALTLSCLFLVVLGGGCRAESNQASSTSALATAETSPTLDQTEPPPSATTSASPGGTALVPATRSGATLLITVNDGALSVPPQNLGAGPIVLTLSNVGTKEHSLRIQGPGLDQQLVDPVQPGKGDSLSTTLAAGTYLLTCPLLDHAKSENAKLTIAPASGQRP